MTKSQMITGILQLVSLGAISGGKKPDGDLFFSLAFMTDRKLRSMCKELGVK